MCSDTLRVPAPAKINLFLRITGRRTDGYHELQTVFQFIDLSDEVTLVLRDDGRVRRVSELPGVAPAADLSVRAALALREFAGAAHGADIHVHKRIPMGGGLGGGSSDAASVLLGLNRLWGLELPLPTLAGIGVRLGADVPVFVHGRAAWAEGVGDRLTPVDIEQREIILALPAVEVPTAAVFGAKDLTRNCIPLTINSFPLAKSSRRMHELMCAGNVCEPVVGARYEVVSRCLQRLREVGPARMTGTGAACFALAPERAMGALRDPDWQLMAVRSLGRSPAHEALGL